MESSGRLRVLLMILIIMKTVECCFEDERVALLQLKSSLNSSSEYSSFYSWGITSDDNCCKWEGVKCSNFSTGRITNLFLLGDYEVAEWKMNASLFFPFQQLTTLSLEIIFIGGSVDNQGFDRLSTLENLESLNLRWNTFKDINSILSSIGRISSLKSLSLNNNEYLNSTTVDIQGLSKLVNLEVLSLSGNYFNNRSTLLSFVSGLSSLKRLYLSDCGLKGTIDLQELDALANLEILSLSRNEITKVVASRDIGVVPRNLSVLFLDNMITPENGSSSNVELHSSLGAYPNLKTISLCGNNFEGPLFVQEEGNYFNNLEELFFNNSYLNEKSFESIKFEGMSSLKRLSFSILYDPFSDASRPKKKLPSLRFFNLKNLEYLDLSGYDLDNNILKDIGKLISLKTLRLISCGLSGILSSTEGILGVVMHTLSNALPPDTWHMNIGATSHMTGDGGLCNLRNLEYLDLRSNEFSGTLPQCIANLTSLQMLDLSHNHFSGSISPLRSLTSLQILDISNNQFQVPLSLESFFNHSNLKYLDGSDNYITYEDHVEVRDSSPKFQLEILSLSTHGNVAGTGIGTGFPKFLWHQHDLQELDLSNIQVKGEFPYWLLHNNTNLWELHLANTSLSGPLHFPNHSHKYLHTLDISNNDLNGTIPLETGQLLPNLHYLNLSGNGLTGGIPSSFVKMRWLFALDLSSNRLSGEIHAHLEIGSFDQMILSNNHFEGQIFPNKPNCYLNELRVDNNNFSGNIPYSLFNCTHLKVFDASNNDLSGQIPGWITNFSSDLVVLVLSKNRFSGSLATQFGPSRIREVYLSENMLQGSLGTSFYNCFDLVTLDLSRNNFSGTIPKWIGELPKLSYLLMSYNNLEGEMPVELCNLEQLSLIDLSNNNLSGHILSCIRPSSKYMKEEGVLNPYLASAPAYMEEPLVFTTKNTTRPFLGSILQYISGMDLSCNIFTGKIPAQIGNLTKIQLLNLSHNSLIGPIPESFSNLTQIESLDLSYNNLNGKIPSQLLQLHWLSVFSVAHNNLSGSTPGMDNQFGTFENTSYEGNPFLCGHPLTKSCYPVPPPLQPNVEEEDEEDGDGGFMDMEAFYVSCVISYIVVLCTIGAVLYVNPYWRRRWFYMIEVRLRNCYYFIEDNLLFPLFNFRASS